MKVKLKTGLIVLFLFTTLLAYSQPQLKEIHMTDGGQIKEALVRMNYYPALVSVGGDGSLQWVRLTFVNKEITVYSNGKVLVPENGDEVTYYPFDTDNAIAEKLKSVGNIKLDYFLTSDPKHVQGKIAGISAPGNSLEMEYRNNGDLRRIRFHVGSLDGNFVFGRYDYQVDRYRRGKMEQVSELQGHSKMKGSVMFDYVPSYNKEYPNAKGKIFKIQNVVGTNFVKYTFSIGYDSAGRVANIGRAKFSYKGGIQIRGRQPGVNIKIIR